MTKKPATYVVIIFVIVAILATFRFFTKQDADAPLDQASNNGPKALPVYTHTASPRVLAEKITGTGVVLAEESVDLTAEASGRITALNITEGARVSKGDLLVKINDAELQAELVRARHLAELARLQADRQKQLLRSRGASQEAFDLAFNELKVREAEVELVEARIQNTEIRAPFDGTIGLRHVSPGSYVTPSTRVATLQRTSTLKIDFSIPERYMDRVETGGEVFVRVAGRDDPFVGKIYAIEPRIDEATRTLRLRARADNPDNRIIPGAFATAEVALREIPDAIVIPAGAIVPSLNQKTVFVLEDGKAQPRQVETGLRLASDVHILSGINAGDIVITSGQLQLRPGMPVKAVDTVATSAGQQP